MNYNINSTVLELFNLQMVEVELRSQDAHVSGLKFQNGNITCISLKLILYIPNSSQSPHDKNGRDETISTLTNSPKLA